MHGKMDRYEWWAIKLFLPHFLSFSRIEHFSHQFRDYKKGLVPSAQPPDPHHPNRSPAEISQGSGDHVGIQWIRRWPQLTTVTVSVGTLTWTCLLTPKTTGLKLHVFPRNNSGSILRFDWSSSADLAFFTNLRIPHPMSNQNSFLGGTRILNSQLSPTSWMITGDPLCTASWSTHC